MKSLEFLTISSKYLITTQNIISEIIKSKNKWIVLSDSKDIDYNDETKWSDFNTLIPTLFLLYHGIETIIKGLLLKNGKINLKTNHNLTEILCLFKKEFKNEKELINVFDKYIIFNKKNSSKLIVSFIKNNPKIKNPEILYNSLRYPTNTTFSIDFDYLPLKYKEEEILPSLKEIIDDVDNILKFSVKIYNDIEK